MTITAIRGPRGEPLAFCTCTACGAETSTPAQHGANAKPQRGGRPGLTIHSEAAVITALIKLGWSNVKNRLRCPKCTAARPAKSEGMMKALDDLNTLRAPTLEQRGDIIELLMDSYDRKARRYAGATTDKTIAELVGGGCLPGWVAEIREANFGPSGGNAEMDQLRKDLDAIPARIGVLRQEYDDHIADTVRRRDVVVSELTDLAKSLSKRLDVLCEAVGPRARAGVSK